MVGKSGHTGNPGKIYEGPGWKFTKIYIDIWAMEREKKYNQSVMTEKVVDGIYNHQLPNFPKNIKGYVKWYFRNPINSL